MDCLFCKIANREIPSTAVYEDDLVYVFEDINPEAPVHVLIIPKVHLDSLNDATEERRLLLGHIQWVASKIAKEKGLDKTGYRLVSNTGKDAQQSVPHLHYHLLGGRSMHWPPG
jgi:histidine triad (HIT) family protein